MKNDDLKVIVDSAYGQNIITVNEFRKLLGLAEIEGGDVCKNQKSLSENWPKNSKKASS